MPVDGVSGWNPLKAIQNFVRVGKSKTDSSVSSGLQQLSKNEVTSPTSNVLKLSDDKVKTSNDLSSISSVHSPAAENAPQKAKELSVLKQIFQALGLVKSKETNSFSSISTSNQQPQVSVKNENVPLRSQEERKLLTEFKTEIQDLKNNKQKLSELRDQMNMLKTDKDAPAHTHKNANLSDSISNLQAQIEIIEMSLKGKIIDNPKLAQTMLNFVKQGGLTSVLDRVIDHMVKSPHLNENDSSNLKSQLSDAKNNPDTYISSLNKALQTHLDHTEIHNEAKLLIKELKELRADNPTDKAKARIQEIETKLNVLLLKDPKIVLKSFFSEGMQLNSSSLSKDVATATIPKDLLQRFDAAPTKVYGMKVAVESLLPQGNSIATDVHLVGVSAASVRALVTTETSNYRDNAKIDMTKTKFGEPGFADSHILFNFSDKNYGGVPRNAQNMALEEMLMHSSRQLLNLQNSGVLPEQRNGLATSGQGQSNALAISNVEMNLGIDSSLKVKIGDREYNFFDAGADAMYRAFVSDAKMNNLDSSNEAFAKFLLDKGVIVQKNPPEIKTILNGIAPTLGGKRAIDKDPNFATDSEVADLFFAVEATNKALIESEKSSGRTEPTTIPAGWFGAGAFSNPGTLVALVEISLAQFNGQDLHFHNYAPGKQELRDSQFAAAKDAYESSIKPMLEANPNLTKDQLLGAIQGIARKERWPLGDVSIA